MKAWGVDTIYKLSVFLRGDADPGLRGVEERFLPPPIALYVDSSEWSGCDISELRRYSRIPSEPVAHGDFSIASRPEILEYPPSVEPETHDFHISIGAIQLTIEEPPEKIADKEPQRIMKERKDKPQAQSTRLARHYIRI